MTVKTTEEPVNEPSNAEHDAGEIAPDAPRSPSPGPSAKCAERREPAAPIGKTAEPDLDSLLSQFDREARQPQQPPARQPQAPPQMDAADAERLLANYEEDTQGEARRQRENEILLSAALDLDQKRTAIIRQQHDRQVLDGLAAEFAPTFAQLGVAAAEINARLAAEERRDAQLRQAMERRFDSPQANQRAIDLSRRAIERVVDELSKRRAFDGAATEDRALVTQSLRGARTAPPPEKRIAWGNLTDKEFDAQKKALGIVSR